MKILPNFFSFLISFLLILLFSFVFFAETAYAGLQDDFQARKNQMLADDTLVWAWLEKCQTNFSYYNDLIWQHHDQIWNYYATRSRRQGLVHMVRARYQYPNCFTQGQRDSIDQFLSDYFTGALYGTQGFWAGAASANQQISVLSSMYLYAERHPSAQVYYALNDQTRIWEDFTYEGRIYSRGNYYNLLAFSRDYLYFIFNKYVTKANYEEPWDYTQEMDSRTYAISQMKAILMLRDLALDATMTKKSDMTFTHVVLNSKMDFSAKHWGGPLATREYANNLTDNSSLDFSWGLFGDWTNYKYVWATAAKDGVGKWDYPVAYDSDSVALISPKSFDSLLLEIGNTDKEIDNSYSHLHIEKNSAHTKHVYVGNQRDSANWMYATKYYNLGGNRNEWSLQVRSKRLDPWGQERAYAFRFWVNNNYVEGDSDPSHYMGKGNIQYKNAIFILNPETRRVMAPDWYIDSQSQSGGWTFYRINTGDEVNGGQNVEVIVAFKDDNRALEVGIVGVDYPSYEAFRSAVLTKASVSGNSFTTSKGDVISTDGSYNYGLINGRPIWEEYGSPVPDFPLLTTYDKNGNKMISWDWATKKLTLSRNGQTKVYNFSNWTTSDSPSPSQSPSSTPSPSIPGDLDADGDVDIFDYNILVENFGASSCGNIADIDRNCRVDIFDYNILVENFGKKQ